MPNYSFSNDELQAWINALEKYDQDHVVFYLGAVRDFPSATPIGKLANEQLGNIVKAKRLIHPLLVGTGTVTESTVREVNRLMLEIDKSVTKISGMVQSSARIRDAVKDIEDRTGVSLKDMKAMFQHMADTDATISRGEKNRSRGGRRHHDHDYGAFGMVGNLLRSRKALSVGVIGALAAPILGPMFGLAGAAVGGITLGAPLAGRAIKGVVGGGLRGMRGLYYGVKNYKRTAKGFGGAIGRTAKGAWGAPDRLHRRIGDWWKTDPWATSSGGAGEDGGSVSPLIQQWGGGEGGGGAAGGGAVAGVGGGLFRTKSRRQKENATDPLFYFFNKRAFTAKWTKRVLAALEGKGSGGGSLIKEGAASVVKTVVQTLAAAGIVKTAIKAVAGKEAAKIVGKKVAGRTVARTVASTVNLGAAAWLGAHAMTYWGDPINPGDWYDPDDAYNTGRRERNRWIREGLLGAHPERHMEDLSPIGLPEGGWGQVWRNIAHGGDPIAHADKTLADKDINLDELTGRVYPKGPTVFMPEHPSLFDLLGRGNILMEETNKKLDELNEETKKVKQTTGPDRRIGDRGSGSLGVIDWLNASGSLGSFQDHITGGR
jgi:hypothetical protein